MTTQDGGSAFPEIGRQFDNDSQEHIYCSIGGMTLRDYFAAKAMFMLAGDLDPRPAAEMAYQYADAMIAARDKNGEAR